jgi:hypothetical protein
LTSNKISSRIRDMDRTDWKEKEQLLRISMANAKPPLQIEKVMEVLGYESKSSAHYALTKLQEKGVVKLIGGKWYLL